MFVDFWNYTLHMKSVDESFLTDWSKLWPVLSRTATGDYQGLNFYGSYNLAGETDQKLHRWATGVVATFPGVKVSMAPRQRKRSPPSCPRCHQPLTTCPGCGADMHGTEEKGSDVRMATDRQPARIGSMGKHGSSMADWSYRSARHPALDDHLSRASTYAW